MGNDEDYAGNKFVPTVASDDTLPPGFKSISEIIEEHRQDPKKRVALDKARKRISRVNALTSDLRNGWDAAVKLLREMEDELESARAETWEKAAKICDDYYASGCIMAAKRIRAEAEKEKNGLQEVPKHTETPG